MNLDTKKHIAQPGRCTEKPITGLRVYGSARLHFGFTDPSGRMGRRYGSIGLAIEEPEYCIHFRRSRQVAGQVVTDATHPATVRLQEFAARVIAHFKYEMHIEIAVEKALAAHAGLGSGTQLAIAAGVATCQLAGDEQDIYQIAALLDRGSRSSIGAAAFDAGGFIVDGGRDGGSQLPPIIARHDFPQHWSLILVSDPRHEGLSADSESQAFDDLPEFSDAASGEICRLLLLKVLPALKTEDFKHFAEGIGRIQEITGDFFSTHQGGDRFTSARVAEATQWLAANGASGVGQSSWGPTGYAFCADERTAHDLIQRIGSLNRANELQFSVTRGKNTGAKIVAAQ